MYRCLDKAPTFGYQASFLSTSTSLDVASQYGDHTLVIKIDPSVKGADCRKLRKRFTEQEIVLERGCKVELVRLSDTQDRWYECIVTKE